MRIVTIALGVLALAAELPAAQRPGLPYLDWGACPFECCDYGEWTVARDTPAYSARSRTSPVAQTLRAGATVHAETGVVVTLKPGRIRVLRPLTLGEGDEATQLNSGDIVYVLHDIGEGFDLLWFNGQTFSDQVHPDIDGNIYGFDSLELLDRPETEWWVKIRTSNGKAVWALADDLNPRELCG